MSRFIIYGRHNISYLPVFYDYVDYVTIFASIYLRNFSLYFVELEDLRYGP